MKFSIKDFSSKYDQIRCFLRIWSHLVEKSLLENFTFCAVKSPIIDVWQGPEYTSENYFRQVKELRKILK